MRVLRIPTHLPILLAALAVAGPGPAQAHDTWLERRVDTKTGGDPRLMQLALSTGSLFPAAESGTPPEAVVDRGCTSSSGRAVPLVPTTQRPDGLWLQAQVPKGERLLDCRVQTTQFEVEIGAALVVRYLREIGAPPAVQEAWVAQERAGLPWRERYTKHARIVFFGEGGPAGSAQGPRGAGAGASAGAGAGSGAGPRAATAGTAMKLDIEIEAPAGEPLRAGDTLAYRVLRDGAPLPGQAVELRGELSRIGLWSRTDAEGRASIKVPLAGRWVLRGTDLQPDSQRGPGHWDSRFVTLAFSALDQPKKTAMPNTRSTSHTEATAAMSAEPPMSTTRR